MATTIGKTFTFAAAHYLSNLPPGHKCARLHGHTYTVTVELTADDLIEPGFVTDFGDLAPFYEYLKVHLDHRLLNDVLDQEPTCELIARHLADWFQRHVEAQIPGRLHALAVAESPTSWARWEVRR
ncbi:6-pyruvoyl trahydropterin synthase family protein [Nocardiopsis chromatogenes]|uniref:6-pyruvoyl trahydropterin synthase family protein n=1 Tax=Nocardiopsis chromatogenes TaxID=280239 RepID=UPI00034A7413|nr:6-carboxytetrahydropterin synthase [Nocardiopsis chromatogenes]